MLVLTESAGTKLAAIMAGKNGPRNKDLAVRISKHRTELGMTFDTAGPQDMTFERCGATVLIMDRTLARSYRNKTLDTKEDERGIQLILR